MREVFAKQIKRIIKKLKHLTLVDYLVILVIVGVILFLGFRLSRVKKTVFVDLTFERVTPGNNFFPPEYWRAEAISQGDAVYNSLGNKIAVVTSVTRLPWGGGSRFYTYITMEMTALYHKAKKIYTYEGNPLTIGQRLEFVIGNASYTGIVKNIYSQMEESSLLKPHREARVQLYCREYEPWHAEAIRALEVKDQSGNVVAKVVNAAIKPAQIAVETSDGRIVEAVHPFKKDLDLDIMLYNLSCTTENLCFYNETQSFSIGSQLWLDSGKTWLGSNCSVKAFTVSR